MIAPVSGSSTTSIHDAFAVGSSAPLRSAEMRVELELLRGCGE